MHIIEFLYLFATAMSVVAMAPQIKQLLMAKKSSEFSLTTWCVWASYQIIAFIYSVTIASLPFMLTNLAWITFYGIMLTLIIKYRVTPSKLAPQEAESRAMPESSSGLFE